MKQTFKKIAAVTIFAATFATAFSSSAFAGSYSRNNYRIKEINRINARNEHRLKELGRPSISNSYIRSITGNMRIDTHRANQLKRHMMYDR